VPAYPTSGVSTANTGIDPSGKTPNLSGAGVLALVSPFTFPSGTFATTCSQFIDHQVSVPGGALTGPSIHAWVQLPPGDADKLAIGADTSSIPKERSLLTSDGYTTPAVPVPRNWAIRVKTN